MPYRLLLVVALLVALAAPARAQTAVSGTVLDESGGALPDASVTLVSDQTRLITVTGGTGQYRFDNVPAGTYAMSVLLIGFAPASRDNVVVGSESVVVPAITVKVAGFEEAVIVTASRIGASLLDAPSTMTVLPAATIAVLPAQNIGDLLRAVPGVNVIQMSARDINITSRQATSTAATSQLALLDGRSIYLDFFGLILWDFVPTNVNDIKQIEVVRGPASAVWGANALTGAVNIITKSPRETAGATNVTLSAGWFDRDVGSTAGKGAGALYGAGVSTSRVVNGTWSYRLSGGYFHSDPLPRPTGQIPVITDPRDPTMTVGGALYPADATGALGTAY